MKKFGMGHDFGRRYRYGKRLGRGLDAEEAARYEVSALREAHRAAQGRDDSVQALRVGERA